MMKVCVICGYPKLNGNNSYAGSVCQCLYDAIGASRSAHKPNEMQILQAQLIKAQSYKADAERYKIIRNLYTKNSDSWTKQEKSIYRIISTEDTNNRRFDEAIDQAMKEGK